MSDVKWIKIVTDIFDDEKILLIESLPEADSIIVIWFKLLCLAGKQNNSGVFQVHGRVPYTDEMFATIFRRKINTVRLALATFEKYGMIEIINDTVTIPNWGKHQSIEQIEARKEYQRNYQRQYYARQKALTNGENSKRLEKHSDKHSSEQNLNTPDKIRLDKNRIDKRENIEHAKRATFTPPTLQEVEEYAREKGYNEREFDPESFICFYGSKDWVVGKTKMKDWKKAASGWVARYRKEHPDAKPQPAPKRIGYYNSIAELHADDEEFDEIARTIQREEGLI